MVGAGCKSYRIASKMIARFLNVNVSAKQVSNLTTWIGTELKEARDERTEAWQNRSLTEPKTEAAPPLQLGCVQVDGGRMQTRRAGAGQGVFDPHWRETKNAGFYRMATKTYASDPCPELPKCFSSRKNMGKMLAGLEEPEGNAPCGDETPDKEIDFSWRPQPLFRSCLSSLECSESFGAMMAAEADRRGFFTAQRRAFLGDGLPYNWSIWEKHFSTFVPILDFIHPIQHLYKVSQAIAPDKQTAWEQAVQWIEEIWQGNVEEVIGVLKTKQTAIGLPPADAEETDARTILAETIGYLTNQSGRMNYPEYRRKGLPITSCLIESQIKEMNHRVKGTEKFWNDGKEGEAILQVTAALLGDAPHLSDHIAARPGSPYDRQTKPK